MITNIIIYYIYIVLKMEHLFKFIYYNKLDYSLILFLNLWLIKSTTKKRTH